MGNADALRGTDDARAGGGRPTFDAVAPDPNAEFHVWLRTQFSDLDGAKRFVWRWMNEWDQHLPQGGGAEWEGEFGYTMRAMAHHVSLALENREVEGDWYATTYLDSEYGAILYGAMCDRQCP